MTDYVSASWRVRTRMPYYGAGILVLNQSPVVIQVAEFGSRIFHGGSIAFLCRLAPLSKRLVDRRIADECRR